MDDIKKARFLQMLTKAMGAYGKPLPEPDLIESWIEMLAPYSLRVIGMAFAAYCDDEDRFPPIPAGIAKRCKQLDGRPGVEEAWAIALASRDEADTVVWTAEIAEAFGICSTVLSSGDEVGARMAFKDAYARLVSNARMMNQPVQWSASLGWDVAKREAAVTKAAAAGLLPAPQARALLPNYTDASAPLDQSPEGLAKVKAMVAELQEQWAAGAQRREAALEEERKAIAARKQAIASQVSTYQQGTQP
jgi:hypothetical protein